MAISIESSSTCISIVACNPTGQPGNNYKLTWKAVSGGIIICFSQGFKPWPDMSGIFESLTDNQVQTLISGAELNVEQVGQNIRLNYMSEKMVSVKSASYDFAVNAKMPLPLKIQLFSISPDGKKVYIPSETANKIVLPAIVKVTLEPAPWYKKGKRITVSGANFNSFPDGFLCYTVRENRQTDRDGSPMQYPIPKHALSGYLLPLNNDFDVQVARKWFGIVVKKDE